MKKSICVVALALFASSVGHTEILWGGEAPMQHEMHGGGMKSGMKMEMATKSIFEGVGKIKALVPEKTQIVIGHEKIKGFMEAMPMGMGYPVESKALLKGLKPGDRVKFKIDAAKKTIVAIEHMKHMKGMH